jgi:RNA-binding protein 25
MTRAMRCSIRTGAQIVEHRIFRPFLTMHLRTRWRHLRARRLTTEEAADAESRVYEERETDNLRRESEAFLARQMEEMQALQEEQRNAGMLLDDGAPVKLNVSLTATNAPKASESTTEKKIILAADEDEDDPAKRRKVSLVKLDFSAAESGEQAKERLENIKFSVPRDKETLFKAKVRWDGLSDVSILKSCCMLAHPLCSRWWTASLSH